MKKISAFALAVFVFVSAFSQQQILLFTETFENGSNTFDFSTGGIGSNSGNNSWTINADYNGAPLYGITPPEDSVVSGTINAAPHSTYLHIHDEVAFTSNGVANANWNTNTASDHFTFIGSPFCTLGMSNVIFTFFYVCEGNTDAYGEVYYRADGGPWTKTGLTKYNNQSKWKYEIIQDPAFNNVQNLQIGFRWVNSANGGNSNVSFGIDDIIAVGTYDNINNPVTINVNSVSPSTVCQGNYLVINYSLSAPLCDGTYRIEMSDKNGNFSSTPFNGGSFSVFAPDTTGSIAMQVPTDSAGNCFKVRVTRISPEPQITGEASACFSIVDCPETVTTVTAPVMNDNDTTCLLSVIDVKFLSTGVFGPNGSINVYKAQLSDANGSFANPYQLGTLYSNQAFPGPPGTVSGLIPANVPPGCGYYIRVISTSPAVVGNPIGPFCLVQCDELTNNHQDINFCIHSGPYPLCDTIAIHPNQWNNHASYDTCNNWTVELRSMMDFSLVNSGGLAVYHDSVGGNFVLCVPPDKSLLPVQPGAYYMRIVSNCSSDPWNQTGSVIRLTIGAPDTTPPVITLIDTVSCNLGLVNLYVNPFNHPPSDYQWSSNGLNNGNPFIWPYDPLSVDFTGAPLNDYIFYVREINYGCYGPYSGKATLTIIGKPHVSISGPVQVCLGDTVTYNVGYLKDTYYNWDAPAGVKVFDEANSQVTMIFDSVGTFTISNFTLNDCGGDSGFYTVKVITLFSADAGADKKICDGDSVQLHVETSALDKLFVTSDTATTGKQGAMFNIIARFDVTIDSFAVKYLSTQPIQAEIWGKNHTYKSFEQSQFTWYQLGGYYNFAPNPIGQFTVIPFWVNQFIPAGDTFAFYVTTANTPAINEAISPGNGPTGTTYKTDGIIDYVQGTANSYPFGAFIGPRVLNVRIYYTTKAGLSYLWNTGDSVATIWAKPSLSSLYSVVAYDTSGCKNRDSVFVQVNARPTVNAGTDTVICEGESYILNATSSVQHVVWMSSNELSDLNSLTPTYNYNSSSPDSVFIITAIIDSSQCAVSDTVIISPKNCKAYIVVPGAFTPNNDGHNDYFTIFGNNIEQYELRIFNRWGEEVYNTHDAGELNDLSRGWDGSFKGKLQDTGTFVYYLTAKDAYGHHYEKKGNLELIR